ncbi:MAG: diacylglycerol kinase family lipid kinase [Bacteroidota bacterium]|nr:diacylglycerol kinase family lipid kinase [Bacteroidota bacterium]
MKGDWFVVVNPNAGNGKGKTDWLQISILLDKAGLTHTNVVTEHKGHAISLVQRFINMGFNRIIVVGGDGTLNEAVNGILRQRRVYPHEVELAMIPVGTGNDWVRTHHIPTDYAQAIEIIRRGNVVRHDAAYVNYMVDGIPKKRYFINMAGMGFDAAVNLKVNEKQGLLQSTQTAYFYHIFTTLLQHSCSRVRLTMDGRVYDTEVFSMATGICCYNGSGMKQLPEAIFNDGLLDVTVIGKVSKSKIVKNVKKLYDGSFTRLKEVETFRCKHLIVESDPLFGMEADGESLPPSVYEIQIMEGALSVLLP